MLAKGQTVIQMMEKLAPKWLAMPEDAIGLQIGTLNKPIRKVLVSLDVTLEVVEEAIQLDADLIISHHAVIFRPLKHLQTDNPMGKIYEKCLKHDIAVYNAHTNLDIAEGGVNDMLADAISLTDTSVLAETYTEKLFKLVVYVPEEQKQDVLNACFAAGAGHIGDYSHCSFQLNGTGTFLPEEGTTPFIGEQGRIEHVKEVRIETIASDRLLKRVVGAMIKAHPYEEPAYDVFPLELKGKSYGLGRVGKLDSAVTLGELTERVKSAYGAAFARIVGDVNKEVKKVAVLGGSGGRYIRHALFHGADVLITGDIDYHAAQDAYADGLCIIDPGHHMEQVMKKGVAEYLQKEIAAAKYDTEVIASDLSTEPFRFV